MKMNHWLIASSAAISLHVVIAYSIISFDLLEKQTIKQVFTGEGISVNLSSYALPAPASTQVLDIPIEEQTPVEVTKEPIKEPIKPVITETPKPPKVAVKKIQAKAKTSKAVVKTTHKQTENSIAVKSTKPVEQSKESTPSTSHTRESTKQANKPKTAIAKPVSEQNNAAPILTSIQTPRTSALQNKATNDYYNQIKRRMLKFHKFPLASKRKKQEGVVKISFIIDKSGKVIEKTIAQSSGYKRLDAAALKTLTKANPFPPIPDSIGKDTISLIIPVNYTLQ